MIFISGKQFKKARLPSFRPASRGIFYRSVLHGKTMPTCNLRRVHHGSLLDSPFLYLIWSCLCCIRQEQQYVSLSVCISVFVSVSAGHTKVCCHKRLRVRSNFQKTFLYRKVTRCSKISTVTQPNPSEFTYLICWGKLKWDYMMTKNSFDKINESTTRKRITRLRSLE